MSFPLVMKPHSPSWKDEFAHESSRVRLALGASLKAIHHIGSTSIPGIHAKPVIDMLAEVNDLTAVDERDFAMQDLGYQSMGEFGLPGRRFFRKSDAEGFRTHHVHAFLAGSAEIKRHLAFRDYLIAHPAIAREYENLKLHLVATCGGDIEVYMDGKDPFIKETERAALKWSVLRNDGEGITDSLSF